MVEGVPFGRRTNPVDRIEFNRLLERVEKLEKLIAGSKDRVKTPDEQKTRGRPKAATKDE